MTAGSLVFIKTDSRGKTKKSDRRLIRSQCMNGKNLRIGLRPAHAEESNSTKHHPTAREPGGNVPPQQRAIRHLLIATSKDGAGAGQVELYEKLAQLALPRALDSDLSALADSAGADARSHLLHFLTHAAHITYPMELCVDFDLGQSDGIRWILEDATYLHFTLFFISAINDVFVSRSFGKKTYYHMGRTIKLLNEKLARSDLQDSTISVVSSLVIVTAIFTDYNAAKAHFIGLQQLIRLRGGLEAFRHNLELYIKLARVDLAYALHTGQAPLFIDAGFLSHAQHSTARSLPRRHFSEQGACDSCHGSLDSSRLATFFPDKFPCCTNVPEALLDDDMVASVFSDLRGLVCKLNRQRCLQDSDFKLTICSIQYRLLLLENTLDGAVSECLRLSMLVFLTTTFQIPEGPGRRYPHLSHVYHESCSAVLQGGSASKPWEDFVMWLLIIGAVSLYGVEEAWIREGWRKVVPVGTTWYDARKRLKRFLWIDALHDKLGLEAFDALSGKDLEAKPVNKGRTSGWWLSGWGMCPLQI